MACSTCFSSKPSKYISVVARLACPISSLIMPILTPERFNTVAKVYTDKVIISNKT